MATPKKKIDRGQNIQVFVRVRPLNEAEKAARSCAVLDTPGSREVVVKEKAASSLTKTFNFDRVFGPSSAQSDVFKHVVGPLLKQVLQGYNCTVFAYGQTGTGKTYTMEGLGEVRGAWENDPNSGIIPRALSSLFDGLRTGDATEWGVRVSFLELYNEEIFDLLSGNDDQSKLRLYEDGQKKGSVIIQGLEEVQVRDKQEVLKILERGSIKRQTAETRMNANSSRSHTVFTVTVFVNQQSIDGDDMLKIGKLNLVDLAGSENIGRSGAVDKRAREAGNINQSLLTLGRVITCLVDRAPHIPYRESKLTRLLQDSLGGRTKTSIIATVSPAAINLEETLSTLDYAHRAKNITNKPEVNQTISKKEKLLEYHREIDNLKAELQAARDKDGVFLPKDTYQEQMKEHERQMEEVKVLTKELKAKELELDHFVSVFEHTKAKLEATTEERDKTKRALDCTRTVLHKTESEKQEQLFLVQKHVETECKLSEQAGLLLAVSDEATTDLRRVHDKVDRLVSIDESNRSAAERFVGEFLSGVDGLRKTVGSHVGASVEFCSERRTAASEELRERSDAKAALSSTYSEAVAKLVEAMAQIEQATSDRMREEQSWVERTLKRTRDEADAQSHAFHEFLVEQLLSVATTVLAAVGAQEKAAKKLSDGVDAAAAGMGAKVEAYMGRKRELSEKRAEEESSFRAGMSKKATDLAEAVEAERVSVEEFKRQTAAFNERMEEMIRARRSEEERFFKERNDGVARTKETLREAEKEVEDAGAAAEAAREEMEGIGTAFEKEHSRDVEKLLRATEEAVEGLGSNGAAVSKAVEGLKMKAEAFVGDGKDAWVRHYERTEAELRQRSEGGSRHVEAVTGLTGGASRTAAASQAAADEALEAQREEERRAAEKASGEAEEMCGRAEGFGAAAEDKLRTMGDEMKRFFDFELERDAPTGRTPMRTARTFPTSLVRGTPDDDRLRKYRAKRDSVFQTPSKFDLDQVKEDGDDADSVYSASTVFSQQNSDGRRQQQRRRDDEGSNDSSSALSSAGLSRQTSSDSLLKRKTAAAGGSKASDDDDEATDKENKESNFARPSVTTRSKLKPPEDFRSRSGSRTRNWAQTSQ